jgi:hypothetical protein
MFEGLREEVDKARWRQDTKRWKKAAAKALGVKRGHVFLALPIDDLGMGSMLVAYFRPKEAPAEVWCQRVANLVGPLAVGEPLQLPRGAWVGHAQNREYEWAWTDSYDFAGNPSISHTDTGLPYFEWAVIQAVLEDHYGVERGQPWPPEAEQRFALDMAAIHTDTVVDGKLRRFYRQLTDPELVKLYEMETDPERIARYRRLMELFPAD